jgi:hypothetical protein
MLKKVSGYLPVDSNKNTGSYAAVATAQCSKFE